MRKTMAFFALFALSFTLAAANAPDSIRPPQGKNLFAGPDSQTGLNGWSNFGGAKIKLERIEKDGRKILRAVSSKPGYHLGLFRSHTLKPATQYLFYTVARGKIAKDSKIVFLYATDARKDVKPLFVRSAKTLTKDFPWTLFTLKFMTPDDPYTGGRAGFYSALFYGQVEAEFANIGLIELGFPEALPKLPAKFRNILNNPQFATGGGARPVDWNQNFDDNGKFFRLEKGPDGKNTMVILPCKKGEVVLHQKEIKLNPGKKYRIGAMIKTEKLNPGVRSGLLLYNTHWTASAGVGTLPVNTKGWKKIEADVTLPPSRYEMYTFGVYTVDNPEGKIYVRDHCCPVKKST